MSKETGGPAFPFVSNGGISDHQYCLPGMTLRDHFAAKAMQGWLASYSENESHPVANGNELEFATMAYKLADAMLKARNQ